MSGQSSRIFFHTFAGLQWLSFMFANTVVIPLSISGVLHLPFAVTAGMMARSFIITGAACLAQVFFGHKLPLMEGQSGIWWGSILSLATVFASSGMTLTAVGGGMAVGILVSGAVIVLAGLLGLTKWLQKVFTPMVMAVLLLLLSTQLIHIFFLGMMGIAGNHKQIQLGVGLLSVCLVILVGSITLFSRGLLGNFSILIGMVIGWIVYDLAFGASHPISPSLHHVVQPFAWGKPTFETGILISMIVIGIINSTNTIATLRAAEPVFGQEVAASEYRKSFITTGIFTMIAGLFTVVPYAPYTSSIGFLRTTRIREKAPFIIGACLFIILGIVPWFVGFFSTMPMSVGDAVLFVAYLQLFGSAMQNLDGVRFNFRTIFRLALPTLSGLAILSTPSSAFTSLPGFLQPICSNGMLVGIILSVVLETAVPWRRLEEA